MDDFGNCLSYHLDGNYLLLLFPYYPDAASMTRSGHLYGGH